MLVMHAACGLPHDGAEAMELWFNVLGGERSSRR
jgi:hypothetical protein